MLHALIGFLERLMRDHAIPVAALASLAAVTLAVVEADREMRASAELARARTAMAAVLAAEEVALAAVGDDLTAPHRYASSWGHEVEVVPIEVGPRSFELSVHALGRQMRFACEYLAGAAPESFGRPLTTPDGSVPDWVDAVAVAGLPPALGPVTQGPLPPTVVVDAEIAMLHLKSGTDRPDYVWPRALARHRVVAGHGGVKVVPGNLWIPPGDGPLCLVLDVPMTIHVAGNLYLGRTIQVEGHGVLTLTAGMLPALSDGPAPIEGTGQVHVGIPASPLPTAITAHLIAAGDIVAHGGTSELHGACFAGSLRRLDPQATVRCTGLRVAQVDRERIPGFATSGKPRPGFLHALPQRPEPALAEGEKTLPFAPGAR